MKQCMDAENLHRRLAKIIGQIQAIDRMVDEDVPCEDVLSLINAAKSALHKCGQVVLEGHIKHCVRDGIEHGDADKTIERDSFMVKFPKLIAAAEEKLKCVHEDVRERDKRLIAGAEFSIKGFSAFLCLQRNGII